MHQLARLSFSSFALLMVGLITALSSGCTAQPGGFQADVVVVGGTPGGIAAAIAAAEQGSNVVLCEPTAHVGGIVGSGLTNVDLLKKNAVGGLFQKFVAGIRAHYRDTYGEKSPQYKECREGFHFEPKVAEATFMGMLNEQKPRLRVLYRHRLARTTVQQNTLTAAVFDDLAAGQQVTLSAKCFVDATYEGDLAAMAGVEYRVGRESRAQFNEKHAGVIYARFGKDEFLPGSTGEGDAGIQGFCFRFMLTKVPENRAPVQKPDGYNRDDYRHLLADITAGKIKSIRQAVQFWPLPNDRFEINSDHPHTDTGVPSESLDMAEENWAWPEASYAQRDRIFTRIWSYQEGLVWFLQNDEQIPRDIREEAGQYGFCKDEFIDNNHRPWQVYVRQGRRIFGEYRLTENDGNLDRALARTKLQPTSIAIAEYPFDSHGVHKFDPAHPGVREGYIYISHPPIQLPYGIIVPQKIDGLLVPVACSATHVGYQTIRMEPVFMALGQAAGIAAHSAIQQKSPVRRVNIEIVQRRIVESGGVITYYGDLPLDHKDFAALQFLGTRGLNPGYTAMPQRPMTRGDALKKLERIFSQSGIECPPMDGNPDAPLEAPAFGRWLQLNAKMEPHPLVLAPIQEKPVTLATFARLLYSGWSNRLEDAAKRLPATRVAAP